MLAKVHQLDQMIMSRAILFSALADYVNDLEMDCETDEELAEVDAEMDVSASFASQEIARLFVQAAGSIEIDQDYVNSRIPVTVYNSPATDPSALDRIADQVGYYIYSEIKGLGVGFTDGIFGDAGDALANATHSLGLDIYIESGDSGNGEIYMGRDHGPYVAGEVRTRSHWDTKENKWEEWTPVKDI